MRPPHWLHGGRQGVFAAKGQCRPVWRRTDRFRPTTAAERDRSIQFKSETATIPQLADASSSPVQRSPSWRSHSSCPAAKEGWAAMSGLHALDLVGSGNWRHAGRVGPPRRTRRHRSGRDVSRPHILAPAAPGTRRLLLLGSRGRAYHALSGHFDFLVTPRSGPVAGRGAPLRVAARHPSQIRLPDGPYEPAFN